MQSTTWTVSVVRFDDRPDHRGLPRNTGHQLPPFLVQGPEDQAFANARSIAMRNVDHTRARVTIRDADAEDADPICRTLYADGWSEEFVEHVTSRVTLSHVIAGVVQSGGPHEEDEPDTDSVRAFFADGTCLAELVRTARGSWRIGDSDYIGNMSASARNTRFRDWLEALGFIARHNGTALVVEDAE
ncbi:hypothetical protein [Amycolatopsis sp. NPDC004079]|uniref:hypothetical protein n=1 Tax=Amycolatopsis sp. NPDC004079 TaxID=3154549 RepID=UPI0033B9E29E